MADSSCDDIAIIGAGIAGTYAAWRLRKQNKQITIYEFSNRVGGRMYTLHFPGIPDINIELGAMRYRPEEHKLLNDTILQLGLPIIDFPLGDGIHRDTRRYVRGVHLREDELGMDRLKTPFNLSAEEFKPVDELRWEMFRNNTDVLTTTVPDAIKQLHVKTRDGVAMYKQSIQSVKHKSISIEAQNYIEQTSPFRATETVTSASMNVMTSPPSTSSKRVSKTVATGMNSIPIALLREFLLTSSRHCLKLNNHLKAITKNGDDSYELYFETTETKKGRTRIQREKMATKRFARKVILAINRLALEILDWEGLRQPRIWELITKSVLDSPNGKYFLAYNEPWWLKSPVYESYTITDTPLNQIYDFGTSKTNPKRSVLLPMYSDFCLSTWLEMAERDNKTTVTDGDIIFPIGKEIIQMTNKYLSEIFKIPVKDIPHPTHGVLCIWKSYPYGGADQAFMPGYIYTDIDKEMVKPSNKDDIYTACNAFNARSWSWWSNSALQAVELIMPYFGLPSTE